MQCMHCSAPATWEFDTRTKDDPAGIGLRPMCDDHAEKARDMIQHTQGHTPMQTRNLLSRIRPLVVV